MSHNVSSLEIKPLGEADSFKIEPSIALYDLAIATWFWFKLTLPHRKPYVTLWYISVGSRQNSFTAGSPRCSGWTSSARPQVSCTQTLDQLSRLVQIGNRSPIRLFPLYGTLSLYSSCLFHVGLTLVLSNKPPCNFSPTRYSLHR